MAIYTIGFTQKSSQVFFDLIKNNHINLLIDIRLNNQSQLAGFTKGRDLPYFLEKICDCSYVHELKFSPTKQILDDYKKNIIVWSQYESLYLELIKNRKVEKLFKDKYLNYKNIVFLCSESTPEMCHRRLLAEYINSFYNLGIHHL